MPSEYQHATARPASLEEETRTAIEEARMAMFFGLWYLFPWTQKLRARRRHSGSPNA
jgi:hypothetical protein